MRYRALSAKGDYTFGAGLNNFLTNTPNTVGQAVLTRLRLPQGEWFLNVTAVTPYATQILGKNTQATYDAAIRQVILDTLGVIDIESYLSNVSPERELSVSAKINTIYGAAQIATTLVSPL